MENVSINTQRRAIFAALLWSSPRHVKMPCPSRFLVPSVINHQTLFLGFWLPVVLRAPPVPLSELRSKQSSQLDCCSLNPPQTPQTPQISSNSSNPSILSNPSNHQAWSHQSPQSFNALSLKPTSSPYSNSARFSAALYISHLSNS